MRQHLVVRGIGRHRRSRPRFSDQLSALDRHASAHRSRRAVQLAHPRASRRHHGTILQALAVATCLQWDAEAFSASNVVATIASHRIDGWSDAKLVLLRDLLLAEAPSAVVAAELGNGLSPEQAVPAALRAFVRGAPSFERSILSAASLGGDVDTICALTGALAARRSAGGLYPNSGWRTWPTSDLASMRSRRSAERCCEACNERVVRRIPLPDGRDCGSRCEAFVTSSRWPCAMRARSKRRPESFPAAGGRSSICTISGNDYSR